MIRELNRTLRFAVKWRSPASDIQEGEVELNRGDRPVPASLFGPSSPTSSAPGWVVLHGLTRPGRHHPTLVRFARALAGSSAWVLVPEIPEWTELYLAPDEASATVRTSLPWLANLPGVRPHSIGVMGFSLGVPQVLLSATDPALKGFLGAVAGFGGYADLDPTIRFLFLGEHEWKGRVHRTEPDPYGRWIIGGNYLERVSGFEDAGDVAQALLSLARQAGDLQVMAGEPRFDAIKEELLSQIHPSRHRLFRLFAPPAGQSPSRAEVEEILPGLVAAAHTAGPQSQPTTFVDRIQVPVRLVHGRGDCLIPYSESLRLAAAFPPDADMRVYLTGLFSHSQADSRGTQGPGIGKQLQFLRIMADLLTLV